MEEIEQTLKPLNDYERGMQDAVPKMARVIEALMRSQKTIENQKHEIEKISLVASKLKNALLDIRQIDLADCEKFVRKADSICCEALTIKQTDDK
tara:strand:- start:964 stop:1248 length:285 start_codon:yes stop_codon:yes gene_type:complete